MSNIFLVAETKINNIGLREYLNSIGADTWYSQGVDCDSSELVEVGGRLCYKSFGVGLNPNVKRVREGNAEYIANIIGSGHGSVLEHASVTFIFEGVSRVFTHELVRHRHGTFSQESLRFLRIEGSIPYYQPEGYPDLKPYMDELAILQEEIQGGYDFDSMGFEEKKKLTSFFRRILPIGLSTTIMWTTNFRNLRHVINLRTSEGAEHEIKEVFERVKEICLERYPHLMIDLERRV